MSHQHPFSRRGFMQGTAAATAVTLGGVQGMSPAHAQALDWKRFKGEKIEVFLVKSPRGDLLRSTTRNSRT